MRARNVRGHEGSVVRQIGQLWLVVGFLWSMCEHKRRSSGRDPGRDPIEDSTQNLAEQLCDLPSKSTLAPLKLRYPVDPHGVERASRTASLAPSTPGSTEVTHAESH